MANYITTLARDLASEAKRAHDFGRVFELLRALPEELEKLAPGDFSPDVQSEFVLLRNKARAFGAISVMSAQDYPSYVNLAEKLIPVLEKYVGAGSGGAVRSFAFIKDHALQSVVERDFAELKLKVYPARAWKSAVVLAGSIMEAILYDQLATDPQVRAKAEASKQAPKEKNTGKIKDLVAGRWSLESLIAVATELNILNPARANSIDQVLRDYRNFIHPKKEIRSGHACSEPEAMMALGALEGVCNTLK